MNVAGAREEFPHDWRAAVLAAPPLILPVRQFTYPQNVPGEEDALGRGALLLEVRSASGGSFLATCALGFRDPTLPTGVWSCPRQEDLLAVAGGYAYRIDTRDPSRCEFLPMRPVTAILPAVSAGLLLLAGFHHVMAVDHEGVRWQTERLSWEGVVLHEVRDRMLHGLGWDMFADREVPFQVDLRDGSHQGGGYLR